MEHERKLYPESKRFSKTDLINQRTKYINHE